MDIDQINELLIKGDYETLYNSGAEFSYDVQILDSSPSFWGDRRHYQGTTEYRKANVIFYKDKILIQKRGFFTGADKGSQTIHYDRISNIDIDKGFLQSNITIGLAGADVVVLRNGRNSVEDVKLVLDNYLELWRKSSSSNNNITNTCSDPDQIAKYHALMEEGIITEEEFEAKKKQILEL